MNIKKDNILIFSIVLTALASAGDLFGWTQHLTIGLTDIQIYKRIIILISISLILFFIYKIFCKNIIDLKKTVFKYLIIIPLCLSLIFIAGIVFSTNDIESEIKFRAQAQAPIQIAMSETEAMKDLDHKRFMQQMNVRVRFKELENEGKRLDLEIEKIKKSNKDGEEVNQDSISN